MKQISSRQLLTGEEIHGFGEIGRLLYQALVLRPGCVLEKVGVNKQI
jgi:glyceraldehyde-3-phosphate dehydrogenase/erythrose-4-phosphate dehydrogenase